MIISIDLRTAFIRMKFKEKIVENNFLKLLNC